MFLVTWQTLVLNIFANIQELYTKAPYLCLVIDTNLFYGSPV